MSLEIEEREYESLADRAYFQLRDQLILLDIAPGSAINEAGLAVDLQIGRTPIREGLKRLELDHLVVSYPRRGTFATRVDITDLADIGELRKVLEPVAAARAARTASPVMRQELAAKADQIAQLDPLAVERRALMQYDLEVHRLLYRAAGNPHMEETLVRADNLATRIWCLVLDRLPTVGDHVSEHALLLRAVVAGDADLAADLAGRHVHHFEESVRAVL